MAGKKGSNSSEKVTSIILAGGEGTRLFPLTKTRCKPDVCFAGRYHLIDIPISNSLNSKIKNIFILSQHFSSALHQHILTTYPLELFHPGGIELLTPSNQEQLFKGTADAVRQTLEALLASSAEYFLILSGDQLYNMDLEELVAFAKREDADLVIASLPVEEREAKRMGLLKIDSSSHVTDFFEKPTDPVILKDFALPEKILSEKNLCFQTPKYLGSMGIYVFKRAALISLLKEEGTDFGKHLIPIQVKRGKTLAFIYEGYWEDIGTISSFYEANLALTSPQNWLGKKDAAHSIYTSSHNFPIPLIKNTWIRDSLINEGAFIEAREIFHSIIGMGSHIKEGTIIRDSIVMGDHFQPFSLAEEGSLRSIVIEEDCLIEKSIIDVHTSIGKGVQLINKNNIENFDGNGVYIRDGIIVVTAGTKLPSGFVL